MNQEQPQQPPAELAPASAQPRPYGKRGAVPGTEAARRGGQANRAKYGREFFSQIGARGGATMKARHGLDFYRQIGQRGGEATKRKQGHEFYVRMGKLGGQRRKLSDAPDA